MRYGITKLSLNNSPVITIPIYNNHGILEESVCQKIGTI